MVRIRIENLSQVVTPLPEGGGLRVVEGGAIEIEGETVAYLGPAEELDLAGDGQVVDGRGGVAIPGLVDCHTHLVFGGDRVEEFEQKLSGVSYREIARRGGGIRYTVRMTRKASKAELKERARHWLRVMASHGVTTVEAKSGYGLDAESEIKILEVIRELDREEEVDLVPTFLGAHELPPDYPGSRDDYIEEVINDQLPQVVERGLARFIDVFCEEGVFDLEQTRRVLEAGRAAGLGLKVHSDQFVRLGATKLAADLGAVSADHLHSSTEEDLIAMKEAGTIPVLLPTVPLFLGEHDHTPAKRMVELGLPVAVATDFNPGSSMCPHLPLAAQLACLVYRLPPAVCLAAITRNAAWALGLSDRGVLMEGFLADLVVVGVDDWRELFYHLGEFPVELVIKRGRVLAFGRGGKAQHGT